MSAEKIYRPVSVWVDIRGLPLHCWVPELIQQMVGKFGIFRKMTNNVFDKTIADVIKVLVEVEDMIVIPRIMHCSYKALSDDRIRSYAVSLEPRGRSLPMSEIDRKNWELAMAASGRTSEVANWREEDLITTAENRAGVAAADDREEGAEGAEQEALIAAGSKDALIEGVEEGAGEKEGADDTEKAGVEEGQAVFEEANPNSNLNLRNNNMGGPSASQRAEIAKGKRPIYDGPNMEKLKKRLLRPFSNSGSDSFNLDLELAHCQGRPVGSDEEISATGPKTTPPPREEQNEQGKEEGEEEEGDSEEVNSTQVRQVMDEGMGEKEREERTDGGVKAEKAKESKKMVMKKRSLPTFGTLQKGSFSFGKRARSTSSSSKSATKSGTKLPPRAKPRPIASLHDDYIAEVSRNVGLKKPLSKSQIEDLKLRERDRASH